MPSTLDTPSSTCEADRPNTSSGSDTIKHDTFDVFTPIELPCGRIVPNRLVKAALYEHLSSFWGGPPNAFHLGLYSQWAHGGWGMILTGNVQVRGDHLGLGRDLVVPRDINSPLEVQPFIALAQVMHGTMGSFNTGTSTVEGGNGTLAIMQLSHAGRQSTTLLGGRSIFEPPLAPSAIPVELKSSQTQTIFSKFVSRVLFQTPKAMTAEDIDDAIEAFKRGAILARKSGFDGIEIHAAHGYLVAGFISLQSNKRTDSYSALTDPLHFLRQIVAEIRGVVPEDFVIGVKLNAADYVHQFPGSDGDDEARVLGHVKEIAGWETVDFIEISGGSYENPDFMSEAGPTEQKSSNKREALFARFSQRARSTLLTSSLANHEKKRPLIMLTGGLTTTDLMVSALSNGHADLLGIGRLSVEVPYLPRVLREPDGVIPPPPTPLPTISDRILSFVEALIKAIWNSIPDVMRPQFPPLVGSGVGMAAYQVAMRRLAVMRITRIPERLLVVPSLADVIRLWIYIAPGPWNGRAANVACWGMVCMAATAMLFGMILS